MMSTTVSFPNRPTRASTRGVAAKSLASGLVLFFVNLSISNAQVTPRMEWPNGQQQGIQQVQGAVLPANRPLPPQIASMPTVQEEMKVIERRSQLIVARSNIARTAIADPSVIEIVQYSPNEISIIGLALGTTTLTIWFEDSPDPLIYLIETIRDPSLEDRTLVDYGKLEKKLAVLFPDSKVYLIPLSRKIIVKGQARDSEQAARILSIVRGEIINQWGGLLGPQSGGGRTDQDVDDVWRSNDWWSSYIIDMLEVPGEFQIMLKVRIAELNRSQLRELGVDWEYLIKGGRHVVSASMGGVPSTLTGIFENGEISVLVHWLAMNGTAKILAEPTLTVLSGHTASFLSGGEFPVPTIVGVGGAQGTSTTFRGFGTSLIVTPTVLDHDLIRMRIIPEYSEISEANGNGGVQGLDSRRVQTTVELREGQTIVLAGLFAHMSHTKVTRIPFFGELPIIGPAIFNAKEASQDETELLILVTPEIVRPMEPDEVPPVPGFYVTHPTDMELYSYAMTEGAPDTGVYQLAPYGTGAGPGIDVGYSRFNPAPSSPAYSPMPTQTFGGGGYTQPFQGYPQAAPFSGGVPNTTPGPTPLTPVPDASVPASPSAYWTGGHSPEILQAGGVMPSAVNGKQHGASSIWPLGFFRSSQPSPVAPQGFQTYPTSPQSGIPRYR